MENLFDVAAVFSNDTDLVTPIRLVTEERLKPVIVVYLGRWEVASYVRHIRPQMVRDAQLPETIPNSTIGKPIDW